MEQLLQRLLLPRIKAALGEPNLAVRQVRVYHRTSIIAPADEFLGSTGNTT